MRVSSKTLERMGVGRQASQHVQQAVEQRTEKSDQLAADIRTAMESVKSHGPDLAPVLDVMAEALVELRKPRSFHMDIERGTDGHITGVMIRQVGD